MNFFNLFSNILVTKGASRIIISDLQRERSELYPLELYDIIEELKKKSIEDVVNSYEENSQEFVSEYLEILTENEFGFITQNDWDKNFPPLSLKYFDTSAISNIFVEINDLSILYILKASIENLNIKHLVIYSKRIFSVDDFLTIESIFKKTSLQGLEVFSPFHDAVDKDFIQGLSEKALRIYNLVFFDCKMSPFKVRDEFTFVVNFTKEKIKITSCGQVDLKYFNTNLPKVLEAINHNSCLHKKIAIDINGNIKNCPAMPQSFGNIKVTTLEEALNQKYFKKYWNLTKDNIEVCKDCEFRYICTDCRAYTEQTHTNKEGLDVSKPLKCGYDPYTGEWEEWSTNPLKQKAINFYGMQDLIKNEN
jgi:SPASM domain peptide maturase of grasp-with-spasm system